MSFDKDRDDALNAIGWEMAELRLSGRLDFEKFKAFFERALLACGDDTDDLEMFMATAQEAEWEEWILERMAAHRAQRVA
jgi:hypothetical protein